jgi:hypothetical protein
MPLNPSVGHFSDDGKVSMGNYPDSAYLRLESKKLIYTPPPLPAAVEVYTPRVIIYFIEGKVTSRHTYFGHLSAEYLPLLCMAASATKSGGF